MRLRREILFMFFVSCIISNYTADCYTVYNDTTHKTGEKHDRIRRTHRADLNLPPSADGGECDSAQQLPATPAHLLGESPAGQGIGLHPQRAGDQDQTYQVTIRWVSGISTTDVILYKDLYFSIKEMTEVRGSHLSFTIQLHNSLNLGKKVVSGGNGSDVPPSTGDGRITEPMIDKLFEED